jgi:biotin synthesis protein BioG
MEIINIQNNKSSSLILFFNGWGFDENCISHLQTLQYDVKLIQDYRIIEKISPSLLTGYDNVIVVAWSFGVWVADVTLQEVAQKINKAYAINGTINPVDDMTGIPKNIFSETLKTLSESSYVKFLERVMGSALNMKQNSAYLPARKFSEQKNELECLAQYFCEFKSGCVLWDRALCGTSDRIFPFENLKHFWGDKMIEKPFPHFVFNHYNDWETLLNDLVSE